MKIEDLQLIKKVIEGVLMAADQPLSRRAIKDVFDELECPDDSLIDQAISELMEANEDRGFDLVKVASGYRYQVKQELSRWIGKLWKERTPRYSRALLETMSLIAYRQPITRGEIENIRGVAVSTQIIKTLLEREWVKVVGHRDVPGRPAVYATTKQFLDYFNLSSLDQLPPLAEIRDLNEISRDFNIEMPPELAALEAEGEVDAEAGGEASAEAAEQEAESVEGFVEGLVESSAEEPALSEDEQVDNSETESDKESELAVLESWSEENESESENENSATTDTPEGSQMAMEASAASNTKQDC